MTGYTSSRADREELPHPQREGARAGRARRAAPRDREGTAVLGAGPQSPQERRGVLEPALDRPDRGRDGSAHALRGRDGRRHGARRGDRRARRPARRGAGRPARRGVGKPGEGSLPLRGVPRAALAPERDPRLDIAAARRAGGGSRRAWSRRSRRRCTARAASSTSCSTRRGSARGRLQIEPTRIDLEAVVRKTVNRLAPIADERGIALELDGARARSPRSPMRSASSRWCAISSTTRSSSRPGVAAWTCSSLGGRRDLGDRGARQRAGHLRRSASARLPGVLAGRRRGIESAAPASGSG